MIDIDINIDEYDISKFIILYYFDYKLFNFHIYK
jgi:hypothetical protein